MLSLMIRSRPGSVHAPKCRRSQSGVVIFLALIVLVALTLGGLALFRSADMGVLIVGNLGSQKSATRSGDAGTEAAVTWLDANGSGTVLHSNNAAAGYVAAGVNDVPATNQTWAQYWSQLTSTYPPKTLTQDTVTGNTVSYLIQRLCDREGPPYDPGPPPVQCVKPSTSVSGGSSKTTDVVPIDRPTSVYYRVTSRIVGPRDTVSFIQALLVK